MKCKGANPSRLSQLAFMAACNMHNVNKAKVYWPRVGAAAQNQFLQMCVRNGSPDTREKYAAMGATVFLESPRG